MHRPALPDVPFTGSQVEALGISRQQLRQLVKRGYVRRVLRGVYQSSETPDSLANRACSAALVMPPHAVACDRTAAWIHGIDVMKYRELEIPPPLDVVVLRSHTPSRRTQWRNGQRDLAPGDVTTVDGLQVTTALRTALDLGCKLPRREALAALDQFMRHGLVTREALESELPRFRGRRGVIQLRSIVPIADPRAESPGESWVRLILVDSGLPPPVPQYSIVVGGFELYRLDLAYPRHLICIEYDGEYHETAHQQIADQERRSWLRAHGWTVVVVTRSDLDRESAERWTAQVRGLLFARTPWPRG